jgi:4-amino-4-deoxy-L-arabinose transferase-like glycosyltransferase
VRAWLSVRFVPRWFREWGPELLFLLVTTGAGLWAAGRWINPISDPGFSWSLAYRLAKGERLYRDIYFAYTPLSPYLLAAGVRLFGASSLHILLANWIPAVAAGFLLLRCGRGLLSLIERVALAGVVMAISLFVGGDGRLVFPYYPGVVHALALSTGALLLLRDDERPERRAFFAGLLAGLAFCCKQEVGIAALFALGTGIATRPARPAGSLVRLVAGFCLVLLPAAAFILAAAPLGSLRADSHLWPLALTPPPAVTHLMHTVSGLHYPNWPLAVRSAGFRVLCQVALLGLASLLLARERQRSNWLRVAALFLGLGLWWILEGFSLLNPLPPLSLSMSIALLVAILAFFVRDLPDRPFLIAFGTFAGLVGLRTAFSPFASGHYSGPGHFATGLTWVVFLCIFVPRLLLGQGRSASYLRSLMALLLLCISWWQAVQGIESLRFPWRVGVETREGRVFVERGLAKLLEAIARHSASGERALIIPETAAVDALFHLTNVSPLVDLLPGWLDESVERQLVQRLEKSPPELVVLFERPVAEYGVKPFGQGYGLLLADWVSRNYRVVESCSAGKILRIRRSGTSESAVEAALRSQPLM